MSGKGSVAHCSFRSRRRPLPQARIASAKTSSTGDQKATKMLRQIIQEYLIKQAGVSLSKFDDPDLMLADLGLDSLGVVEMLYEVEDRYGFQVQEPYRYSTMRFIDIVADLESTIRAKNNGELPEPKRTEA
jgi:acyl carrier protein